MLEPGRKRYPLSILVLCSVVATLCVVPEGKGHAGQLAIGIVLRGPGPGLGILLLEGAHQDRRDVVVEADLQHLVAAHEQAHLTAHPVLQNLNIAHAALLPLAVRVAVDLHACWRIFELIFFYLDSDYRYRTYLRKKRSGFYKHMILFKVL
jgi:hypothetical protein